MKLFKMAGSILLGGAAMLVTLPACGASAEGSTPDLATPQATATATATAPQTSATATATATATAPQTSATATATATVTVPQTSASVAPAPTSPAGPSNSDLLARGKLIFEKTAGKLGCAFCHGLNGRGVGQAGIPAPDIRGKNEGAVRIALQGGVPMMGFIKLSDDEITAVVAYLQHLATQ